MNLRRRGHAPLELAAGCRSVCRWRRWPAGRKNKLLCYLPDNEVHRLARLHCGRPAMIAVAHAPPPVCVPASSFTARLTPFVKLGASFTLVTVTVKVFLTAATPIGRAAVVGHTHRDRGRAAGVGHWRVTQTPGRVGTGVGDARIGNQPRVARTGRDVRHTLPAVWPRTNPAQVDGLQTGIFVDRQVAGALSVGASFTLVTVTVNVFVTAATPPLAVPPSSVTITVIVAVPLALATGV